MNRPRNRTILTLVVAVIIYVGVITAIWSYSFYRWRDVSKNYTNTMLQGIALNVEDLLYVMNQYANTFLSAFGAVQVDDHGFSRLVLSNEQLNHMLQADCGQILHDFVQSNDLILGAFFCFEPGVATDTAYQPYCHRDDSLVRQVSDLFPFTNSDLFITVKNLHHHWWHASKRKSVFNEAVLGCCLPVYLNDTSHFIGIFDMDYALDSLGAYLRSVRPYPSSALYIVNSLNYIIAETDSLYYGKTITDVPYWTNTSTYGNAMIDFSRLPWKLVMVTPRSEIFSNLRSYLICVAIIALIGLLLLCQCVYVVVRLVRRSAREQETMTAEIKMAATIQRSFLPPSLPNLPDVEINALLQPAKEVAGDLYEVQYEQDYLYFMVGDVSGKGLQSSLMMAMIGGMFRMRVHEQMRPVQIMQLMNLAISERNPEMQFCTILIGRLHLPTGSLILCNAGHNLPILNDHFLTLEPGLPIGIELNYAYNELTLHLQASDHLYLYTDGVTEAENPHHQLFGDERLLSLCQQNASLATISQSVETFVNGYPQSDDITLLTFTYHRLVLHSINDIELLHDYLSPVVCHLSPDMAELAIEEALVNALTHGKATYVSLLINQQSAIIEDDGLPFDPVAYNLSPVACRLSPEPGGHGINLIRQITSSMTYERILNTNRLTLTFS